MTEVCINAPGEAFLETRAGGCGGSSPLRVSTGAGGWRSSSRMPRGSASMRPRRSSRPGLPPDERIQIVLPPATSAGTVAITIRRPAEEVWSVEELSRRGIFQRTRRASPALDETEQQLTSLLAAEPSRSSCARRCARRKNILVSGPTGSGKTTWTKALIREIPGEERLVTIEDARELVLDPHPNHVRLFYSKDDQGLSRVTPKQLLESCLRMSPDRILLAELRAEEAFDYLRNVNSGSPGLDHEHPCGERRTRIRAAGAPGQAKSAGRELAPGRHQASPLPPDRCRHPIRARAPRALHS